MDSIIDIIISAFPGLQGWYDTARVVITAIPAFGPLVPPFLLAAVSGFLFIFGFDYLLGEGE